MASSIKIIKRPALKETDAQDGVLIYMTKSAGTVDTAQLAAYLAQQQGTNKSAAMAALDQVSQAIVTLCKLGHNVQVPYLGTFSLQASGSELQDGTVVTPFALNLRFRPARELNLGATQDVEVTSAPLVLRNPTVASLTDAATQSLNATLTPGGLAGVKGSHLRFSTEAEDEGIYFCPDTEGGTEIKVQEVLDNRPCALSFKIPATLAAGAAYHVEIRTRLNGKKLLRGRGVSTLTAAAAA